MNKQVSILLLVTALVWSFLIFGLIKVHYGPFPTGVKIIFELLWLQLFIQATRFFKRVMDQVRTKP